MTSSVFMTKSEKYVQNLIFEKYGIFLQKIDSRDGKDGQEPDFEYVNNNERIFVCELKEYEPINPTEAAGWKINRQIDGSSEASRDCIAPSRISRCIHEAYKQLKKYEVPKILIFLNHYIGLDVNDLDATYRG